MVAYFKLLKSNPVFAMAFCLKDRSSAKEPAPATAEASRFGQLRDSLATLEGPRPRIMSTWSKAYQPKHLLRALWSLLVGMWGLLISRAVGGVLE